jgi:hypothetical protein
MERSEMRDLWSAHPGLRFAPSGLLAALIARDEARKWRPYIKWPRDIEQTEDEQFAAENWSASNADDSIAFEDA